MRIFILILPIFLFSGPIKNGRFVDRQNFKLILGELKIKARSEVSAQIALRDLIKAVDCNEIVTPQTLQILKRLGYLGDNVQLDQDFLEVVKERLAK